MSFTRKHINTQNPLYLLACQHCPLNDIGACRWPNNLVIDNLQILKVCFYPGLFHWLALRQAPSVVVVRGDSQYRVYCMGYVHLFDKALRRGEAGLLSILSLAYLGLIENVFGLRVNYAVRRAAKIPTPRHIDVITGHR